MSDEKLTLIKAVCEEWVNERAVYHELTAFLPALTRKISKDRVEAKGEAGERVLKILQK